MLAKYVEAAMRQAKYEILSDDNTFYGYVPGFDRVYANSEDLEACRSELKEVLKEWIMLGVSRHLPLPVIDGIRLVVEEAVRCPSWDLQKDLTYQIFAVSGVRRSLFEWKTPVHVERHDSLAPS